MRFGYLAEWQSPAYSFGTRKKTQSCIASVIGLAHDLTLHPRSRSAFHFTLVSQPLTEVRFHQLRISIPPATHPWHKH
jgi:hypothetical protein